MTMTSVNATYYPMYDPEAVQPMRDELTAVGFEELITPEEVDAALAPQDNETVFCLINSVCGCSAGSARPGASMALQHRTIPDRLATVFAGMDIAATQHLRQKYLHEFPPSSPSMALLKNGQVLFMLHRRDIEGRHPQQIAEVLAEVFDQYCNRTGPSVSPEQYAQVMHAVACGSTIPRYSVK
jgi:putative YphP/YqiW family bacilliredoxin